MVLKFSTYEHPDGDSFLEELTGILTDPPHIAGEIVFEVLSYVTKAAVVTAFLYLLARFGWKSIQDRRYDALERRVQELEQQKTV